jgi:Xaa-Pro aminopeptidase
VTGIADRPAIPSRRYIERIRQVRSIARDGGFAAVLVGVGADMRYLAGYPAMPLERLTMLVIPANGDAVLVAPRLEVTPARNCPPAAADDLPVVTWEETDDAHALVA